MRIQISSIDQRQRRKSDESVCSHTIDDDCIHRRTHLTKDKTNISHTNPTSPRRAEFTRTRWKRAVFLWTRLLPFILLYVRTSTFTTRHSNPTMISPTSLILRSRIYTPSCTPTDEPCPFHRCTSHCQQDWIAYHGWSVGAARTCPFSASQSSDPCLLRKLEPIITEKLQTDQMLSNGH